MKSKIHTCLILLLAVGLKVYAQDLYKDPQAPVTKRVEDLLRQMTWEEKINEMIQDAPANSRLGIPTMYHGECLHGLRLKGATSFPQAIALGSTWNPELIRQVASGIAQEARDAGISHCYSPVLDVARDPRYGRIEECYGEDPYLVGKMGTAFIQGLQGTGEERFDKNHIIATAKHFAGYSEPQQGLNGAYVDISKRTLYEIFLPPFEEAVKLAQVGSIMPGHQDLEGVPCHMNKWLLNDISREEWGFDGFVISDHTDVYRLHAMHRIAENKVEAAILGLEAGVDMDLVLNMSAKATSYSPEVLLKAMEKHPSLKEDIDRSVSRILKAKFELGLFEGQEDRKKEATSLKKNQQLALEAAQQSVVLLKNENQLLPLKRDDPRSIAVIGPNAHADDLEEAVTLLGGYTKAPPFYVSIRDGLQKKVGKSIDIHYAEGCSLLDTVKTGFNAALEAAKRSDLVVMALGGSLATCGEGKDRDDLGLVGLQEDLLKEVMALGKPVVLVLINGRPLTFNWAAENVPVILEAWYPGMLGGEAIADILFGDYNPGGKLTVSFPRNLGQIPVTYLQKPSFIGKGKGRYFGKPDQTPLFPFGYGLSYTTFQYSDMDINKTVISKNGTATVKVKVTNTGKMEGDEIVQMYVQDDYASVGRYTMKLKGFKRIHLKPGESREVEFPVGFNELSLRDVNLDKVIEPGDFTIFIGPSSKENDLISIKLEVKD